ncbi:MAG: hypothetical protein NZ518_02790 [Dehalococcoidia bacterium]|nr:hypothetical protein [Dehalococcoidia bacterium]
MNFVSNPPLSAPAPTGGQPNFRGISLLPNVVNDGWIISDSSQNNVPVYRWNDTLALGASSVPVVISTSLVAVNIASPSLAFVSSADNDRRIYRWDGASWSPTTSLPASLRAQVNSIAVSTNNRGWAVGNNGLILSWNGSAWL